MTASVPKRFAYIPPMLSSAARFAIVSVEPWKVTRFLVLNALSVRVTVSRLVPRNSAISWRVKTFAFQYRGVDGYVPRRHRTVSRETGSARRVRPLGKTSATAENVLQNGAARHPPRQDLFWSPVRATRRNNKHQAIKRWILNSKADIRGTHF